MTMTLDEKWQAAFMPHPPDPYIDELGVLHLPCYTIRDGPDANADHPLVGTSPITACGLAAIQALEKQVYAESVRQTFRIVRGGKHE
jgi:phage portal protein BeeE